MADVLLLRLEAPLMAFGGVIVDEYGVTRDFPATSMVTGLLGNTLGWDHREGERLNDLQDRLRFAVRCDRAGVALRDFQTVDLGQWHLDAKRVGWTRSGKVDERADGKAKKGTHIRYRDYLVDASYTLAVTLVPPEPSPTIQELAHALARPARPLYLGRKPCLPSAPVLLRSAPLPAVGVLAALVAVPRVQRQSSTLAPGAGVRAWWPDDEPVPPGVDLDQSRLLAVYDRRDWKNQIHSGRRFVREGLIHPPPPEDLHA